MDIPQFRHYQFNHIRSPLAPLSASGSSTSPSSHHYFMAQPACSVSIESSPVSNKRSRSGSRSRPTSITARDQDTDMYDGRRLRINTNAVSTGLPTPPLSASSSQSSGGSSLASLSSFPLSFSSLQGWDPSAAGITSEPVIYTSPERLPGITDKTAISISNYQAALEDQARLVQNYAAKGFGTPALRSTNEYARALSNGRSSSFSAGTAPSHIDGSSPAINVLKRSLSNGPLSADLLVRSAASTCEPPAAPTLDNQHLEIPSDQKNWDQERFVDGLVGTAMHAIESIWNVTPSSESKASKVLPLKYFITETLRRSRSGFSTLQVALYYLHRARVQIRERVVYAEQTKARFAKLAAERQSSPPQHSSIAAGYPTPPTSPTDEFTSAAAEVLAASRDPVVCGRRMFLAALISASKFLQDRNYSNRAWSRLSGLPVNEINANERAFLDLMEYKLHISVDTFNSWTARLQKLAQEKQSRQSLSDLRSQSEYLPAPSMADGPVGSLRSPIASVHAQKAALARSMTDFDLSRRRSVGLPTPAASPNCAPLTSLRRQSEALRHSTSSLPGLLAYNSPAPLPGGMSAARPDYLRRMSTTECRSRTQQWNPLSATETVC